MEENNIPSKYKPIGAWGYFGYQLLFSLPIIGFILLIVFSFSDENINRRNFARSYWCALLIGIIFIVFIAILAAVFGFSYMSIINTLNN